MSSPEPTFDAETIFRRARSLAELPPELTLPSVEWSLLLAVTGRHTVAQLGAVFGLGPEARNRAFASLLTQGLIAERQITLREYLDARRGRAADEPRTLSSFLGAETSEPPFVAFDFAEEELLSPKKDPTLASVIALPGRRRLNLKALMQFLIRRAPSAEAGQLDIYRAFLKLDPEMLRTHGITTLRFEDDRMIDSPELERKIVDCVESTLRLKVPAEVFV